MTAVEILNVARRRRLVGTVSLAVRCQLLHCVGRVREANATGVKAVTTHFVNEVRRIYQLLPYILALVVHDTVEQRQRFGILRIELNAEWI